MTEVPFRDVKKQPIVTAQYQQHTPGHHNCPVCERARTMPLVVIAPSQSFSDASLLWLKSRSNNPLSAPVRTRRNGRGRIRPNSIRSYEQYIASLSLFFGDMPLENIHIGNILAYQDARRNGDPPFIRKRRPNRNVQASPSPVQEKKVNQELSILHMIMAQAECWTKDIADHYAPLEVMINKKERALTFEERLIWLETAQMKRRWEVVHWYSLLAFETSAGTNELRNLRIGDVNLYQRTIYIPPEAAKNYARSRYIPIVTAEGRWAAERLMQRADELGSRSPLHYLFPMRRRDHTYDPSTPMTVSGIRAPWDEVRAASGLKDFTPYNTRHTALTHWAESGMTIEEMMALAGHLTPDQTRDYAKISPGAQRKARERAEQMRKEEMEFTRKQPQSIGRDRQRAWG